MRKQVCFIFFTFLLAGHIIAGIPDEPYLQEVAANIFIENANENVLKLLKQDASIFALTSSDLYEYDGRSWAKRASNELFTTAYASDKTLIFAAIGKIMVKQKTGEWQSLALPSQDSVLAVLEWPGHGLLAGTSRGLYLYHTQWEKILPLSDRRVNALTMGHQNQVWAATNSGLYRFMKNEWVHLDEFVMASGLQAHYTSLISAEGGNHIIFGGPFAIGCIGSSLVNHRRHGFALRTRDLH